MHLTCKSCGQSIPAEDMNLDRLVAKCRSCNAVFGFAEDLGLPAEGKRRKREEVPLPEGITAEETGEGLALVRRWYSSKLIFLVFFCAIWDGFLIFWYSMALRPGVPLAMAIFPI